MNDRVKIARGNKSLLKVVAKLLIEGYRGLEEYGETDYRRALRYVSWLYSRDKNGFFVAYVNNKIAGFIFCDKNWYSYFENRRVGEIHELVILPEFRRMGIATALIIKAMEYMKRDVVELWVGEKNYPAINLYRKLGFQMKEKYNIWIRMVKKIK